MKNILTFNVEKDGLMRAQIEMVLEFLDETGSAATFFINGVEAEKNPNIVRLIHGNGHEIASHGYEGTPVYRQTPGEFVADIRKSIVLLEDITGEYLYGYRAPGWTITERSGWALPYLKRNGFLYDASFFPQKHTGYGIAKGPRLPCFINITRGGKERILEVPPSSMSVMDYRFVFSSRFLRGCPELVLRFQIGGIYSTGNPVICFLEPHELDLCRGIVKAYLMREPMTTIKDFFTEKGFLNDDV